MRVQGQVAASRFIGTLAAMDAFGFEFQAMASACEIRLEGDDEDGLGAAARKAVDEVKRIELKYSRYRDDSIVSRINAAAGSGMRVEVDAETAALLDFGARLHAGSDGLFDITSGVLRRAWDFRAARLPDSAALAALLPLIGWSQVEWDGGRIGLPREGMELDFGGFGKEYAADRAMAVLAACGLRHGFVNLGGDIRVLGPRVDGRAWRFGIQHPRREQETIARVELSQGALASSGDYERFFELDGKRYCHILDPRTGWPVTAWASISVTAPACVAAGALSTIAMLKGGQALDFLATQRATYLATDPGLRCFHHGLAEADRFEYGESA
ncbi:MAG: FAD:protein FMN transferase [Caldimonas sp.]